MYWYLTCRGGMYCMTRDCDIGSYCSLVALDAFQSHMRPAIGGYEMSVRRDKWPIRCAESNPTSTSEPSLRNVGDEHASDLLSLANPISADILSKSPCC